MTSSTHRPRRALRTSSARGAADVLAAAREHKAAADRAEVSLLNDALAWARLHLVAEDAGSDDAATWGDSPVPIAGPGAPTVSEFCLAEFAAAIGRTTESGRFMIAHALELAYRLPNVWSRVQAGELQVWRARRIAEKTLALTPDAAAHVDLVVAPLAHQIGVARLDRLVDEAIATFMPETALELAQEAAETRKVALHHDPAFSGTSYVSGNLDLADALDLEAALQVGAAHLADQGSSATLDVRRSQALGLIARTFTSTFEGHAQRPVRQVVLYVHTTHDNLATQGGVATLENAGGQLITVNQVRAWCDTPGTTTQVIVKPVIDLDDPLGTDGYAIPERIREHVLLRDRTCVFPWCNRNARRCDCDHITPYDPGGPPCQTCTDNLAALCRRHHRLKTHGGWTYSTLDPGTYLWRSPLGYTYLRDADGTRDITARPVEPPAMVA
ncbi:HNH endonuclease [Nocardioides marmoriginsengisoli]|uniref:HNH endonuclease n=1 Tax=Nocardioides marmoriginsengisoli TaxID=661483 RepID=A0A3N0CHZ7_9ACTN|nr:HNH endonuclease signature motif containing protein [Nocardioides marmoriginsengisoli]RNL63050.1 HNH endonuclease [Nocardioides marmoriginsengisoli]